ncbi:hypothetical protein [Streptomyces sp. NPDC059247]|uniref:hypothetical protein n=1 Tax=Streptomyces sp. NPDC059247 TaxID=3346790 RepID=UPI00368F5061
MTLHTGWLTAQGQTRQGTRHTAFGATTPAGPLSVRSGILPGDYEGRYRVGGLKMIGTGPMTATVYHGRAVVQGAVAQGAYPVALDQDTVLTFADGDPLNPRVDLVVLRVYDDQVDGSKRTEATVEIVKGTPAAVPATPATPPTSLALHAVKVPAGTSAGTGGILWTGGALIDHRVTTAGVGGIMPVYGNAAVPGAYPGQYQDNDNSHLLQRWDGTAWVAYPKELGGIAPTGTLSTGGYTGQFRDNAGTLQRWNGTAWVAYQPPVEVESRTTGLTPADGWTVTSFTARRTRGIVTLNALVTRAGADIVSGANGQITDQPLCTLPAGWSPPGNFEAVAADGWGHGNARIESTGRVVLRSWVSNGVLSAGRYLSVCATYIQ